LDYYRAFRQKDIEGQNEWFDECRQRGLVYVQVLTRTKLAVVQWDYISLDPQQDSRLDAHSQRLRDELFDIYSKVSTSRSLVYGTTSVGHIDGLVIEQAHEAARSISLLFRQVLALEN